jgi:hypothetical protein
MNATNMFKTKCNFPKLRPRKWVLKTQVSLNVISKKFRKHFEAKWFQKMLRNLSTKSGKVQTAEGLEGVEAENDFSSVNAEKESAILAEFYRTMSFGFVYFLNTSTLRCVVFHQIYKGKYFFQFLFQRSIFEENFTPSNRGLLCIMYILYFEILHVKSISLIFQFSILQEHFYGKTYQANFSFIILKILHTHLFMFVQSIRFIIIPNT